MLHFCLETPIELLWFGEFISPEREWKHLTRRLYEYEMMVVTEGELCIGDSDREYTVKAGEYLIMSPTLFQHGTKVCRCRFYWMHFRCPALPASVSLAPHGEFADADAVRTIAELLLSSEAAFPRSVRSRYLATQLLLELCRGREETAAKSETSKSRLCENIRNFVTFHRFSEIRVSDLARELGYHEKYISAVFHAETGVTLKRYLTQCRLDEAKRLLLETDYTVSEVSYYLNFQSPHNFSRFFRKETGMTASEFRNASPPAPTAPTPPTAPASPAASPAPASPPSPSVDAD